MILVIHQQPCRADAVGMSSVRIRKDAGCGEVMNT